MFRNLCHFSNIKKTGVTHDSIFDFNKALAELQSGKGLTVDGVLTPLIKQLTEAALRAELEQHLESDSQPNRKNGTSKNR